jgi:16S rRNA processing protein RimM
MPQPGAENPPHDGADLVRVARIGRPHGIRGDVTVQLFTDEPEERFVPGAVLEARRPKGAAGGIDGTLTVARARWNKDVLLLGFTGATDRNRAEELRGTELFAAPDAAGGDDAWYEEDLVGLAVLVEGRRVGTVTGLVTGEVQDLLEVGLEGGAEALVPFVEEIVPEVDTEAGTVTLTPPPGLLALNDDTGETGGNAETGETAGDPA